MQSRPDAFPRPVSRARALAAFAVGALFFGYAFVQRVAPSVMTAELMREFAVGGAALGALSAWYFYAYAGLQIPVGMLNDRFGPRKLMSVAVALCALGSAGFALSESLAAASLFRALIGAAVAFAFVGTLTIAGYWFAPARFAMLAGAVQTVGMGGAVLGQAPLRYAVEQVGWRGTVGALGLLALLIAVLLFVIVPRDRSPNSPAPNPPANKLTDNAAGAWAGLRAVAGNPQSWACAGIGFGMTAIMLAFAGLWAVPWLHSVHGYSVARGAAVVSLVFVGWALGAPLAGWLSDYIGRRKPAICAGAAGNIVLFAIVLFADAHAPRAHAVLFFLLGVSGSMMTAAFGSIREVNLPRHGATAIGLLNMCVVGSGAVMQPLLGWLLDLGWDGNIIDGAHAYGDDNYTAAFSALLAVNLLALICVWRLRETYCRPMQLNAQ